MSDATNTDPLDQNIDFSGGKRGPVIPPDLGKLRITIRLDKRVIDYFKAQVIGAGGGSYQNLINQALLEHIERQEHGERYKEDELRRVLEEVLAARKDAA